MTRFEIFTNNYPAQRSRRTEIATLLTASLVVLGILLPIPARAQTETVIYNFTYPTYTAPLGCPPGSVNESPHTGLLFYKGYLYGTTPEGGAGAKRVSDSKDGMVFRLAKPTTGTLWGERTLHSFQPEPNPQPPTLDGTYPCARLIEKDGALIGTTMAGGTDVGTIFALTPPATGQTAWTETILYNFLGLGDGGEPFDGLVMGSNGALYGVTRSGMDGLNASAVFQFANGEITRLTNTVEIIYNGDLLLDHSTGSLFGTTQNGGAYGYGNVFELTPSGGSWILDDLYDFTGGSDGANPNGGLAGGAGDLFGTTRGGGSGLDCSTCGVLFELRQEIAGNPYTLIVQHTFQGQVLNDGAIPGAGLYKDATGTLWGTTVYGGQLVLRHSDLNFGTVFELYPDPVIVHDWHYAVVYRFGGEPDGAYPQSLLTEDKTGNVYGTTNAGGSANEGTVFQLKP
jgi:uncharacterized repeat protein (TIGR03803 family)